MTEEIRKPVVNDLPQVLRIEQDTFPDPWSQDIFFRIILGNGKVMIDDNVFINMWVLGSKDTVLGYVIWEETLVEEYGHLLNIAVKEEKRSMGFGKALLSFAFAQMQSAGVKTCELEVRETNQIARRLYSKAGMMAVDRVKGYYNSEDAIIYAIEF